MEDYAIQQEGNMAIDIKQIGEFGVSFSKALDQTWFFMKKVDTGYSMSLYQLVDDGSDRENDLVDKTTIISFEQGEAILRQVFENACLEQWKKRYTQDDDGPTTELNWTIDVDDLDCKDMLMVSGNWKFPPNGWMTEVLRALRTGEAEFGKCFKDLL